MSEPALSSPAARLLVAEQSLHGQETPSKVHHRLRTGAALPGCRRLFTPTPATARELRPIADEPQLERFRRRKQRSFYGRKKTQRARRCAVEPVAFYGRKKTQRP